MKLFFINKEAIYIPLTNAEQLGSNNILKQNKNLII